MNREIMQQALHHLVDLADDLRRIPSDIAQTIAALEAELAKPEPVQVRPHEFIAMASKQANMVGKPVVWTEYPTPFKIILDEGWEWRHEQRAREAELAKLEQEPVAWMLTLPDGTYDWILDGQDCDGYIPLYTAPPLKEWVGLTDDEVNLILWQGVFDAKDIRAIETKLKEKNGAL